MFGCSVCKGSAATAGVALKETLDQLISTNQITSPLAAEIQSNFEISFLEVMNKEVDNKMMFKEANISVYRFCTDVWTFVIEKPHFRLAGEPITCDKVKIIALDDSKIPKPETLGI